MSTAHAHAEHLDPALRRVLALVPEGAERERFRLLFLSATRAIDALVELDMHEYEHDETHGADLQVWEALAPVVRETIEHVNEVLTLVQDRFPAPITSVPLDADAAFDELFGGDVTPPRPVPARRPPVQEAAAAIHAIAGSMAREITTFGEGLRRPRIAGNRYELLAHLGEHRGRFRAGIGEMLQIAASAFAEVHREDIVPGYQEDVEAAVTIRRTVTLLSSTVGTHNEHVRGASGGELRTSVRRVATDLDTFGRTAAFRLLRVADKLAFRTARREIERCLTTPTTDSELRQVVEGLDKFLDSLSVINRREILIAHDRAMLEAIHEHLTRTRAALAEGRLDRARAELQSAHRAAQRLFGRDRRLDILLGAARALDTAALDERELAEAAAELDATLATVLVS